MPDQIGVPAAEAAPEPGTRESDPAGAVAPDAADPEPVVDTASPEPVVDAVIALATDVAIPDAQATADARARLGGEERAAALGRLAELAGWWAAVRGDAAAAPPRQILLVGASAGAARRRPGARVLPLPTGADPAAVAGHEATPEAVAAGVAQAIDEAVRSAVSWGRDAADDAADRGVDLIVLSLDDETATRALTAHLLDLDAVEASGWPTDRGLTDVEWMDEVAALRDQLRRLPARYAADAGPTDLLLALGSAATAGAVALLARAGARRTPALLDGPGAAAAALLARQADYRLAEWWTAPHRTEAALHERALASLGLDPLLRLRIDVEDGTAALAGLAVLDQAAGLLAAQAPDGPA